MTKISHTKSSHQEWLGYYMKGYYPDVVFPINSY